jgi:Uma2 family endonuclease
LALAGVPYYWFVDAEERFLEVWELQSNQEWKIIKTLTENDGEKRIEPFTTVALSTQKLLEKDW